MGLGLPISLSSRLDGRRALITGAGRGIGLGCASARAGAGASVVLCARWMEEIDAGAEAIRLRGGGAQVSGLGRDGSAAAQIEALGPFDILVNNAGTNRPRTFAD